MGHNDTHVSLSCYYCIQSTIVYLYYGELTLLKWRLYYSDVHLRHTSLWVCTEGPPATNIGYMYIGGGASVKWGKQNISYMATHACMILS